MKKSTIIIFLIAVLTLTGSIIYKYNYQRPETQSELSQIDRNISKLEEDQAINPSVKTAATLSALYLQKVRETADTAYYQKIEKLMEESLKLDPNNAEIYATQSSVALGRHNFTLGLELANKAISINPDKALYYGLKTDAHIELGQYQEAIDSAQKMVDTTPDLASYSRVAYLRELYGEIEASKASLKQAIEAGSGFPENISWSYIELAKLNARTDLNEAINNVNASLSITKDYPPALDEQAKILYFQNKPEEAKTKAEQAFKILPIAQYATTLGDIYQNEGNNTKANQQFILAKIAYEQSTTSGTNTDQEYALFLLDHNLELDNALTKAQNAFKQRPSNASSGVLAWALYKNNKIDEAVKQINLALEPVGKNDAQINFFAGLIYAKSGDKTKAKQFLLTSQTLNPHFSIIHKKGLEETLNQLQ